MVNPNLKFLFDAIKSRDVDLTKYLLAKHIHEEEHLIAAISSDRYLANLTWSFLNIDIDLKITNTRGITPFNYALSMNFREIIDIFLMIPNIDLSQTGNDGTSRFPLYYAAKNKDIDLMQTLLDRNADINQKTYSGGTAFTWAYSCRYGYGENPLIDFFLKIPELDVNSKDNVMEGTPLMDAVTNHDVEVVEKLLKVPGIDVFAIDRFGKTALFNAKRAPGNEAIVQLLLDYINSIKN